MQRNHSSSSSVVSTFPKSLHLTWKNTNFIGKPLRRAAQLSIVSSHCCGTYTRKQMNGNLPTRILLSMLPILKNPKDGNDTSPKRRALGCSPIANQTCAYWC